MSNKSFTLTPKVVQNWAAFDSLPRYMKEYLWYEPASPATSTKIVPPDEWARVTARHQATRRIATLRLYGATHPQAATKAEAIKHALGAK